MFENLKPAPVDPILGLKEQFDSDPHEGKVNLVVGVYKDSDGKTPVLNCVKAAEQRLVEEETSKGYLKITGLEELGGEVQALLFGASHEIVSSGRAFTAQTPGGTGALRVAADFIHRVLPDAKVWLSDPTWANHKNIFAAAGVQIGQYPYYDSDGKSLDFDAMKSALATIPSSDVVLLHGCCHNPTGCDPTEEQWREIKDLSEKQGFLPFFDFAYQGFGDGIDDDAAGLRIFASEGCRLLVASSFSKNFSIYNERVGALTVVDATRASADLAFGHIRSCIRANYSNPPAHGGAAVTTVLSTPDLREEWIADVAAMRSRLNTMRALFVEKLAARGVGDRFGFIASQRGMFSFSGLTPDQVKRMRDEFGIYIVNSGRINVAGLTTANIDTVCDAIACVVGA